MLGWAAGTVEGGRRMEVVISTVGRAAVVADGEGMGEVMETT